MTTVANASVVFKDKNGNVGKVKAPSANDITKIRTAISDVAQVVDPASHLPINATTSSVGVVQLADSAAVAAGTAGRVVDAAQLKDAIEHVTPAGNLMTTDTAQTVTAVKTFSSLPESSVVPTTANQLVNKQYVDDHVPSISNMVTTDTAQTISGAKTFSADITGNLSGNATSATKATQDGDGNTISRTYVKLTGNQTVAGVKTFSSVPVCATNPSDNNQLTNKAYVDAQILANLPVPTGTILPYGSSTIPSGYLLCNGAAVSRTKYAGLFARIGTAYGAGDGSTTFNLPDMRDRYPIGAGTNTLGTKLAEQLPNVNGELRAASRQGSDLQYNGYFLLAKGAFSLDASALSVPAPYASGTPDDSRLRNAIFSANRSSSIYADHGSVIPLSLTLNYIIKT